MSSSKIGKRYCKIIQYIERHDPDLANLIKNVCLDGIRGTFLYPTKQQIQKILNLGYSSESEKAMDIIQSLTIPVTISKPEDFKNAGNMLGIKFEVDKIANGKVTLKNGAVLEKAADFEPHKYYNRKDKKYADRNISIWKIVSGEAPMTGDEYTIPYKGYKKGGCETNRMMGGQENKRSTINAKVTIDFKNYVNSGMKTVNPYLSKVLGLLSHLQVKHPELYKKAVQCLSYDPITTFYILFEPFKTSGEFLVPDEIIGELSDIDVFKGSGSDAYKEHFKSFSKCSDTWMAVDTIRKGLISNTMNHKTIINKLKEVYTNLVTNNRIGGKSDVFMVKCEDVEKKMWQDMFRFDIIVNRLVPEIYENCDGLSGGELGNRFEEIVRFIETSYPGNNYANEMQIIRNLNQIPTDQCHRATLILFIRSCYLLYTPACPSFMDKWQLSSEELCKKALSMENTLYNYLPKLGEYTKSQEAMITGAAELYKRL